MSDSPLMSEQFANTELEAYLDEALPSEQMAQIEAALRDNPALVDRMTALVGRQDAGVHSLGATWRRHRLSCLSREQLGSFLLEVLDPAQADYVQFHLETIGCRLCHASLEDLRQQHTASTAEESKTRRHKYFQSSAGYLSSED